MSTPIAPETRAKILSSIKDEGTSIQEAAKTYNLAEDTIRRWIRGTADNAGRSLDKSPLVLLEESRSVLVPVEAEGRFMVQGRG